MRLIFRSSGGPVSTVYYRIFDADDTLHWIGLADGKIDLSRYGRNSRDAYKDLSPGHSKVTMELKWGGITGSAIVSAKKQYSEHSNVVITPVMTPVEITTEPMDLIKLSGKSDQTILRNRGREESEQTFMLDAKKAADIAMAVVDGLIGGYAKTSVVLGTSKTGVGLAGQILSLFGSNTKPEPLKLEDITSSLIEALSQNEAKVQSAKIMLVSRWLDHYISKSIALSTQGNAAGQDLSEYDKQEFRDELNAHLDGRTEFIGALAVLEHNREIRKYAIPEYIMGLTLRLHMERLHLHVKKEQSPLDEHDIAKIISLAQGYVTTLHECESDFKKLRADLIRKYPLIDSSWEDYTNPAPGSGIIDVVDMSGPEGSCFGRGITVKYLAGDRWLIIKTISALSALIKEMESYNLAETSPPKAPEVKSLQ